MAFPNNTPYGLRPVFAYTGGNATQKLTEYEISPTYNRYIFQNDPVAFADAPAAADGTANQRVGSINKISLWLPQYIQNAAGNANVFRQVTPMLGVFVECEYYDATNRLVISNYWPAAQNAHPTKPVIARVLDDPTMVYEAQVSTPINATANGAFAVNGAVTAAPCFPAIGTDPANSSGIGSNYTLMGGGGRNFNTVRNAFDTTTFYKPNPEGTMVGIAVANNGTPITDFGNNPYGGNPNTGQSGAYLCVNTYGVNTVTSLTGATTVANSANDYDHTAATHPLKAIGYSRNAIPAPGLTLATTPFVSVLVMINNHVFKAGTRGQTFIA